jgi:hypothetical protein
MSLQSQHCNLLRRVDESVFFYTQCKYTYIIHVYVCMYMCFHVCMYMYVCHVCMYAYIYMYISDMLRVVEEMNIYA